MAEKIRILNARVPVGGNARDQIDTMLDLAAGLRFEDPVQAMELAQTANERSFQIEFGGDPYIQGVAVSCRLLAELNNDLDNFDLALSYLFNALSSFEELNDPKQIAHALDGIGQVYSRLGAYHEASQYFEQELQLIKSDEDGKATADLLLRIGKVGVYAGDSSRTLSSLRQAYMLYEDLNDLQGRAAALAAISNAWITLENYVEARRFCEESVDLFQKLHLTRDRVGMMNTLAEVQAELGDDEKARLQLQKSLRLARKNNLQYEAASAIYQLAGLDLKSGDLTRAAGRYQQGLEISQQTGARQLSAMFHRRLADLEEKRGDFPAAFRHSRLHHELQEDLMNEAAAARLHNMEIAFRAETSRQELRIYRQKTAALKDEIAERKKIEDDLRQTNLQLRQEIVEREHLISDLDSFSYMVAHDLKNPLQVVMFGSQMLLENLKDTLDDESVFSLQNILQMGHKMRAIIDELLVLASVRQQEITLQPLDMIAVLRDVRSRLKTLIDETSAEIIQPEQWPVALGHSPWVEEVWTNYISNGLKYGGKPPRIELGATPLGDGYIRFWVRDNGIGLGENSRERLFTPFKRFNQLHATGHGLGLSIVKRIVEKLGGEVSAESDGKGKGSVFGFTHD